VSEETAKVLVEFTVPSGPEDPVTRVRKGLAGEWEGPDGEPWGVRVLDAAPDAGLLGTDLMPEQVEQIREEFAHTTMTAEPPDAGDVGAVIEQVALALAEIGGDKWDLLSDAGKSLYRRDAKPYAERIVAVFAAREAVLRAALEAVISELTPYVDTQHPKVAYMMPDYSTRVIDLSEQIAKIRATLANPSTSAQRLLAVAEAARELTDGIRNRNAGFTINAERLMEKVDALRSLDGKDGASDER